MVDITVPTGDTLNFGTTGDDAATFEGPLTGANLGNGGMDVAILTDAAADSLTNFTATETLFDAANTDAEWFTGSAVFGGTLDDSFTSVTTADGYTFEAGVAWANGVSVYAGPTPAFDATDGSYSAAVTTAYTYEFDGADLNVTDLSTWTLIEFDGNPAGALATSPSSDGAGTLTVDNTGANLEFTPNTSALAGDYNVGDTVNFTYDVVLQDPTGTMTETVSVTYVVPIDWTGVGDSAMGGSGDDSITDGGNIVWAGPDGMYGTADDITFTTITGLDGGDDLLSGGDGDDSLFGGEGSDTVKGGNGGDMVVDNGTGATDSNFLGGGAGDDTISSNSQTGAGDTLVGAGGDDTLWGYLGNDTLNSGGGDDTLWGDDGDDFLRGGDGNDSLSGGNDDDTLKAGDGDDSVNGGSGNDVLFTSKGDDDTLEGGGGEDTFVLKAGTGNTIITDFDGSTGDELDVTALGYTTVAQVMEVAYELAGGGVVIQIDADTSVTLNGVVLTDLDSTDFEFA